MGEDGCNVGYNLAESDSLKEPSGIGNEADEHTADVSDGNIPFEKPARQVTVLKAARISYRCVEEMLTQEMVTGEER